MRGCASRCGPPTEGLLYPSEVNLLRAGLTNASSYVEWGAGLSTEMALEALSTAEQPAVHSIENQAGWCSVIQGRSRVACLAACIRGAGGTFSMHCIRDGAQLEGYHFDRNRSVHKPEYRFDGVFTRVKDMVVSAREPAFHYVRAASDLLADLRATFDVMLIDGRWRRACALQAWLLAGPHSRIFFHDWQRTGYHRSTSRFFTVVGKAGRLVQLAPRPHSADKEEAAWSELLLALDDPQ